MVIDIFPFLLLLSTLFACKQEAATPAEPKPSSFSAEPVVKVLEPMILETSGIADSQTYPGHLWAHEDSGTPEQLYLLSHQGKVTKRLPIKGAYNRDWEEMARSGSDLYLADIGDNREIYEQYWIYQIPEPGPEVDTIRTYKTIQFVYEDGSHDAEAILVEPASKDIYIITKRDSLSLIFKLSTPHNYTGLNTAKQVGILPYTQVVGAAISEDGKEIIVKTYPELFHYTRKEGESLEQTLQGSYQSLAYQLEPQGEAVTFARNNSGFFTLSEKSFAPMVNLYFYPRK